MFRQREPFEGKHGYNFEVREARTCKQLFCRAPRPLRNIIILLLITFLTRQFLTSQTTWSNLDTKTRPNAVFSRSRIAIVAFITDQQSYIHLSLRNKDYYAKLHGYDLYIDYESRSPRGTTWHKFDMVESVISAGQHDWVWYMDFDTLITNTSIQLTDIIEESLENATEPDMIDFLVTDDCNGLNDGSFIVRSSPRSIQLLNEIRAVHDREKEESGRLLGDQESMAIFLRSNTRLSQHTMRIPQWKINSFPEEIGCSDRHQREWSRGMFVVHFAGAWAHVSGEDPTGQLMRKYEPEISW